jgi:alkaline phosphatase D
VSVWWEIARDLEFKERLGAGEVMASAARDFTVKVDADKLRPGRTYYYRFFAQGRQSMIGRTKTAGVGRLDRLRLGVVSCSNYAAGYFLGYRELATRADLDAVLHLGDYIYEYGGGDEGRAHEPPREILTLEDYRTRYAQYRSDPDLQAAHQQHPFIIVWDDHESANNSWMEGAQNHNPGEGEWADRKRFAQQVWHEWQPVREQEDFRIWRRLQFGDLVDLVMLDTRLWGREEQDNRIEQQRVEGRHLLGPDQKAWLLDSLNQCKSRWFVVGQQVMMGQLKAAGRPNSQGGGTIVNNDQWDGYWASRDIFFEAVRAADQTNVVVLTGDIHTSWAINLTEDPNNRMHYDRETGEGTIAVEFVTPGVTSPGLPFLTPQIERVLSGNNPHIRWYDLTRRGYMILDINPERVQAAWFLFEDVSSPAGSSTFAAAYSSLASEPRVREDAEPAAPPADPAPLAPRPA